MNRHSITNKRNGLRFAQESEASFPLRHPEYGPPAGVKLKELCDAWELANGSAAGKDDEGRDLWSFPDSIEVVTTNIDAEVTAETAKKNAIAAAKARVAAYDDDTATPAQAKQNRKDTALLLKHLLGG